MYQVFARGSFRLEIVPVLTQILNEVQNQEETTELGLERALRVFRLRSVDKVKPKDVHCCLLVFKLEEFLQKSHIAKKIEYNSKIHLYQDLSKLTLDLRKQLQLTKPLRDKSVN